MITTKSELFLGVDGGGTRCRARLCDASGVKLAEGEAGPANIRFGLQEAFASVLEATLSCLEQAQLSSQDLPRITACLALAGATEPAELGAARLHQQAFGRAVLTSDAHAACVGAHDGRDGAILIIGTGSIGWAVLRGRHHRVGGWGLPVSDEGSGAWLGCETLRRVLAAYDGQIAWTGLLRAVFEQFGADPHAIVGWVSRALPREFGSLAPTVTEHAARGDAAAVELMRLAAGHLDAIAARLISLGEARLALAGGLAPHMEEWLSAETRRRLVAPLGDALEGALQLARLSAQSAAA
jgi:glucosamine kinase